MRHSKTFSVLLLAISMSGCATILGGGSSQPLSLSSTPSDARYTITSSSGVEMGGGAIPATIRLPRKNEYQVNISLAGYETRTLAVTKGINGWIWGNLVIGWILGFAIDFLTGSAYKLEPALINVSLERGDETVAVVHFMNRDGKLLSEEHLTMVPIR